MSLTQNLQKSTFTQEFAKLTEQRDNVLDNLRKRGYLVTTSQSTSQSTINALYYHVKDRAGHYLGSAAEPEVKPGLSANAIESRKYLNRQVLVKKLSELSARLQTDGGDQINVNTMKLDALGYKTAVSHLENSILVKVANTDAKDVRELHVNKKEILNGTENKAIAGWLTTITTDLVKQRGRQPSKDTANG